MDLLQNDELFQKIDDRNNGQYDDESDAESDAEENDAEESDDTKHNIDISKLKVNDLRKYLKQYDLQTKGKKGVLVERLQAFLQKK